MYCCYCGEQVADGQKFCPNCGKSVTGDSGVKKMSLRCKSCGAVMSIDENNREFYCPFCGEKEILLDSDTVAAEKVRSSAYKEVEMEKIRQKKEEREYEENKAAKNEYKKSKLRKWSIIFAVIFLLMAFVSFQDGDILQGIIAVVQTVLMSISWLMGMQIIKEKPRGMHVVFA